MNTDAPHGPFLRLFRKAPLGGLFMLSEAEDLLRAAGKTIDADVVRAAHERIVELQERVAEAIVDEKRDAAQVERLTKLLASAQEDVRSLRARCDRAERDVSERTGQAHVFALEAALAYQLLKGQQPNMPATGAFIKARETLIAAGPAGTAGAHQADAQLMRGLLRATILRLDPESACACPPGCPQHLWRSCLELSDLCPTIAFQRVLDWLEHQDEKDRRQAHHETEAEKVSRDMDQLVLQDSGGAPSDMGGKESNAGDTCADVAPSAVAQAPGPPPVAAALGADGGPPRDCEHGCKPFDCHVSGCLNEDIPF